MKHALHFALSLVAFPVLPALAIAQECEALASVVDLGGQAVGAGPVPRLSYYGAPVLGMPFGLLVEGAAPSSIVAFAVGFSGASCPIPTLGGLAHLVDPLLAVDVATADGAGVASSALSLSVVGSRLCGLEFTAQAVVVDAGFPAGARLTAGKRIRFGLSAAPSGSPFQESYGVESASDLAAGDINMDGRIDVVVADANGPSVRVLLNDGVGGFSRGQEVSVGQYPRSIVLADFDGDRVLDFATANAGGSVSIALGDGVSGFLDSQTIDAGSSWRDAAVGDLNLDGQVDLVVSGSGALRALLGAGDGSFVLAATKHLNQYTPNEFRLADFNGDGFLDVVGVSTYLTHVEGVGDGSFGVFSAQSIDFYPSAHGVEVVDVDGDGLVDAVVAATSADRIKIFRGDGSGFTTTGLVSLSGIDSPRCVDLRDVNGDGHPDIVAVGGNASGQVAVFPSDRLGGFGAAQLVDVGAWPGEMVLVDLDGRGLPDVCYVDDSDLGVGILLNRLVD
ncbi:FG-GAP repeat protein [Planctomycetes bacterium Pla163]|uniref:FG-GAP repeat protein n=1 Tax=Rohdeia mirabilis TaxID=2528008 RepID=A0A518CXU2_9BACT|nr:FG-GAP repeat protein [Planctomycetes bacterium Pla163]